MKFKTSHILSIIGLLLLLYFIGSLNFNLSTLLLIKQPQYIPASIAAYIFFFFTSAIRMNYFLKSLDNKTYNLKTLIKIEFISKYIYYITPSKLYVPAKALLLNKLCNIRKSTGIAITSFEYVIDATITIFLALCGTTFLFRESLNISPDKLTLMLITIIALTIIYISTPQRFIEHIHNKANKLSNKSIKKIATATINLIKTTRNTWNELLFNKKMKYILPITTLQLVIIAVPTKLLFLSMTTNIPLVWIIAVSASALFISGISQIPGGIGIREGTAIILYSALGIPKEITLIVVLTSRLYTIIPLILGWYYSTNINIKSKTDNSWHRLSPEQNSGV